MRLSFYFIFIAFTWFLLLLLLSSWSHSCLTRLARCVGGGLFDSAVAKVAAWPSRASEFWLKKQPRPPSPPRPTRPAWCMDLVAAVVTEGVTEEVTEVVIEVVIVTETAAGAARLLALALDWASEARTGEAVAQNPAVETATEGTVEIEGIEGTEEAVTEVTEATESGPEQTVVSAAAVEVGAATGAFYHCST